MADVISSQGGIRAVLQVMSLYEDDPMLLRTCIDALCNLEDDPTSTTEMVSEGAAAILVVTISMMLNTDFDLLFMAWSCRLKLYSGMSGMKRWC